MRTNHARADEPAAGSARLHAWLPVQAWSAPDGARDRRAIQDHAPGVVRPPESARAERAVAETAERRPDLESSDASRRGRCRAGLSSRADPRPHRGGGAAPPPWG